jgi:uroporphyrinogen-III synthase
MSDTLPPEKRISIDELIVYETGMMESFEAEFSTCVKKAIADLNLNDTTTTVSHQQQQKTKKMWVVVFSPTGCDAMLRVLNALLPITTTTTAQSAEAAKREDTKRYYLATIGPTTRDYLISKHEVEPDVCAEMPSPQGVGESIEAFLKREEGV